MGGGGPASTDLLTKVQVYNFDIDKYLNPIVPAPRWHLIPYPIAHFLGHRTHLRKTKLGNVTMACWAWIGVFVAILLTELATRGIPDVHESGMLIVASFGAAAVLQFYTIEAPLAQPRNSVGGQIISVVIGVCISKLFEMSPHYESIRWIGGAIACATATAAMALTKTVHPPAGATALLAVVDRTAASLGWRLIGVVIVGSLVMMGTALLVNNIQNKFPMYWWTPEDLRPERPDVFKEKEEVDVEGRVVRTITLDEESLTDVDADSGAEIVLQKDKLIIRGNVSLSPEEQELLETISERL